MDTHTQWGGWTCIWRALWGRGYWSPWLSKWQWLCHVFLMKVSRSTEIRRFTGSELLCWPLQVHCERGSFTLARVQPWNWNCGVTAGIPLNVVDLYRPVLPQGLSLEASLTCLRGEDQLFHEPPAMMLSQPIKILFHSQQGSWQPWVSPAGWTGCN